jgi:polysaccharide pyruvyl transferase WcaK-like protein
MKKVLLKGYYGTSNAGDDLLLMKVLETIPANCRITVLGNPDKFESFGEKFPNAHFEEAGSTRTRVGKCARHDALVLGGGGLFPNRRGSVGQYAELITALLLGKRIVVAGIGINPQKGTIERCLWNLIAKRAAFFSVRDRASMTLFEDGKGNSPVCDGEDLLLGGFPSQSSPAPERMPRSNYALFVPAWFPGILSGEDGDKRLGQLVSEFASAMEAAVEAGLEPVVMSFYPKDDDLVLQGIAERCPRACLLRYQADFTAEQIGSMVGGARLCVCMRFHAFVAAVLAGKPAVAVAYDHKFTSLVTALGCDIPVLEYGISEEVCFGVRKDLPLGALAAATKELLKRPDNVGGDPYPQLPKMAAVASHIHKRVADALR